MEKIVSTITLKLYFNQSHRPLNALKTFYIDETVSCYKCSLPLCKLADNSRQSIDEAMAKFKGRSSLKQYFPQRPIKREIKICIRSDTLTGYAYDLDIYCEKKTICNELALEERVMIKFCHCFTTVNL